MYVPKNVCIFNESPGSNTGFADFSSVTPKETYEKQVFWKGKALTALFELWRTESEKNVPLKKWKVLFHQDNTLGQK